MVKLPSKSETAPWFCPWTTMLTPASGSPSSESVTEPEMLCACKPVQTAIKAIKKFNIDLQSKLLISKRAHIILPTHKIIDASSEASKGKKKIGSTLKGIGPTYMDKTGRNGIRVGDIVNSNWKNKYQILKEIL